MEISGTLKDIFFKISPLAFDESMKDKRFILKEETKKRSLDSNAYLWVLLGKLQNVLRIPKEELYRNYIKEIGDFNIVCCQEEAVDKLLESWHKQGLGWVTETEESKIPHCKNVTLYYGSSVYDTKTMSRLLNRVTEDCIEQGIETKPKEYIESLLQLEAKYRDKEKK